MTISPLHYVIILIIIVGIDLSMILYINKNMYVDMLNNINKNSNIELSNLRVFSSAIIVYLLLTLSILLYVVQHENRNYINIFINGFVLGIIIYGIYDCTNLATIKEFGIKEAFIDVVWGGLLCGLTSLSSKYIINNLHP